MSYTIKTCWKSEGDESPFGKVNDDQTVGRTFSSDPLRLHCYISCLWWNRLLLLYDRPLANNDQLLKDCQNASEDPTYYWITAQTNIFPLGLLTAETTLCRSLMAPYPSRCYWQSWVSVERQGCSQGFHITFHADSWLSTGFTDLWWVSAASSITARMALKSGSVSGVSGVVSDGSLERSKSSGGWWKVT